jgi:hypothetical protein
MPCSETVALRAASVALTTASHKVGKFVVLGQMVVEALGLAGKSRS